MTLTEYLSTLDTCDNSWGLYVNPDNTDDYRIGQNTFENGGLLDGKVKVANLDDVSFGSEDDSENAADWWVSQELPLILEELTQEDS